MSSNKEIQHLMSNYNFTCFIVPSLFSKDECKNLLTPKIKAAFEKAISNYPTYYRNNDRLQIDDQLLANTLFDKVKNHLPNIIETKAKIKSENGKWQLSNLNERLRYCKYSTNQYFHRHLDGIHYRSADEQSKLTFMIYLNGANDFDGGRTLFYETKTSKEILAAYIPQQGDLIVFDHNVWHEGEILTKGEKFVLRSDILYKRLVPISEKLLPFEGHLGYIWKILKFDANTVISGGRDRGIKIWNKDGILMQSLSGHKNSIISIEKISNDCFISASRDRAIKMWTRNIANEFLLKRTFYLHDAIVLSLSKLEGNLFASSSGDNKIKIASIDGVVINTLSEHENWVWQIVSLKKGFLASCSEDCTIKIWNYTKSKSLFTFTHKFGLSSMLFIEDKNMLICGDFNGEILIKNLANDFSEMSTKTIKAHNGIIRTLVQLNTTMIASGGEDNKIVIWNIETGKSNGEYFHDNFVQSITVVEENKILSASYDGTIKQINVNTSN